MGSSPRCADSFSPTKSRNRLSDASLGPDWCTVVHQVRVLSVFFFFALFFFLDSSRVSQYDPWSEAHFGNLSTQGNSCWVGCGVIRRRSSPVKKMRKRVHLHFSSFDIGNMVCADVRCKPNALTSAFGDVAKAIHMDIDCPIKYWIVESKN